MRPFRALCFSLLLTPFSIPAVAGETDPKLKQEIEKFAAGYAETFGKQDPAGMASKYAKDGVLVLQGGPQTDIAKGYAGTFKAGFNHDKITVQEVSPLGDGAALGMGEFLVSGKSESGAPLEIDGRWTAVYVKEDGQWKIRMLTAFPKPPTK